MRTTNRSAAPEAAAFAALGLVGRSGRAFSFGRVLLRLRHLQHSLLDLSPTRADRHFQAYPGGSERRQSLVHAHGSRIAANTEASPRCGARTARSGNTRPQAAPTDGSVEVGIAYGTEKRNWLEWAVREFSTTDDGKDIRINLIPMGSMEAAHAILNGDKQIHVWSPASRLYTETFLRDREARYKGTPILKQEYLALTPLVFVMWKARYEAFRVKCPEISFRTIGYAMKARSGWGTIAGKPEWGRFKFSHTHPNQSNSGLVSLLLLAYEFQDKTSGLTVSDIMTQEFQEHLARIEQGVIGLQNSTGNLMRDMVLRAVELRCRHGL